MDQTLSVTVDENPELRQTVADVRRTIAAVAVDEGRPVDQLLARLPRTLERMPGLAAQGERSLTQITELSRTIEPALPEVGKTLRAARPVVRRSASVLPESAQQLRNANEVLQAVVALEPTLRTSFMSLGRTGTRLDQSVTPALKRETVLGLPAYMQLLAGFAGATSQLSGFRTREQSPLGWGHGLRGTTDYFVPTHGPEKDIP
jgi:ABC-type transporter Mla subunit MlaD